MKEMFEKEGVTYKTQSSYKNYISYIRAIRKLKELKLIKLKETLNTFPPTKVWKLNIRGETVVRLLGVKK